MRKVISLLLICVLVLTPAPAYAWNKAGHMLVAAIAFQVLKAESPTTIDKVIAKLKEHPHFEDRWEDRLEGRPAEQQAEYMFMLAARWPDDVRGDPDYDVPKWHYVNFPFKPADQPDAVDTAPPEWENVIRAFGINQNLIESSDNDEERAVALCWLFHLVGDVHQPLHTVTLFTTDFPQGDRGGTRFHVRSEGVTVSLHKFWDDSVMSSEKYSSVHNRAAGFLNRPNFQRANLPELSECAIDNWAKTESLRIAREVAYRQGNLEGSLEESSAPELPNDYASTVKPIAERRAMLAGYRLADLLKESFP